METSEKDVIVLLMTRKTAVAAFGALSLAERRGNDPEIGEALAEFLKALAAAQKAK